MTPAPRDTAIVLTPAGTAAIAVVRLVGTGAAEFLRAHFSKPVAPGRSVHGELVDQGRVIDDPVVVFDPERFVADINVHGGTWVVRSLLELARRAGFEVIEKTQMPLPTEAIDAATTLQGEMLAHLPGARTELAVRTLLAQPAAWEKLMARANVLDNEARASVARELLADRSLHWLLHPPRVAIVGAANVGKSTLANQLFAQERSITANLPGTTRDWVGEIANINGLAVMLVDTPGDRVTRDAIEEKAIERSRDIIGEANLIVLVLDATQPLELQGSLIERYPQAIRVINKIDRTAAWDLSQVDALHTIATRGEGVDELRRAICARFDCDAASSDSQSPWHERPRLWTDRHRELIRSGNLEML